MYPILYEEIVVKTDWALARFFKTIKTMPALKDRVRVFWPLYWYSNSVVSPYFVGEFPRLQELSLMNDLKLLSTPYELDYNKFTGDDEEDAFLADIDNDNMDDIDAEIARELASPSTPLGRGDTTSVVQHKGKGKDKGKGKQRQVEPEPDVKSTPEIALKRAKARRISQQLKQMDQRRTERETKPTVVHLKTLEVTMNGLRELPRMNINLDQLETLAIVWVPKPAHEFHTPLPSLKTLYLSTYQIQSDREYEPQMLRVLKASLPDCASQTSPFPTLDLTPTSSRITPSPRSTAPSCSTYTSTSEGSTTTSRATSLPSAQTSSPSPSSRPSSTPTASTTATLPSSPSVSVSPSRLSPPSSRRRRSSTRPSPRWTSPSGPSSRRSGCSSSTGTCRITGSRSGSRSGRRSPRTTDGSCLMGGEEGGSGSWRRSWNARRRLSGRPTQVWASPVPPMRTTRLLLLIRRRARTMTIGTRRMGRSPWSVAHPRLLPFPPRPLPSADSLSCSSFVLIQTP